MVLPPYVCQSCSARASSEENQTAPTFQIPLSFPRRQTKQSTTKPCHSALRTNVDARPNPAVLEKRNVSLPQNDGPRRCRGCLLESNAATRVRCPPPPPPSRPSPMHPYYSDLESPASTFSRTTETRCWSVAVAVSVRSLLDSCRSRKTEPPLAPPPPRPPQEWHHHLHHLRHLHYLHHACRRSPPATPRFPPRAMRQGRPPLWRPGGLWQCGPIVWP